MIADDEMTRCVEAYNKWERSNRGEAIISIPQLVEAILREVGWRPIETAPKDGTNYLIYVREFKQPVRMSSYEITERFVNGKSDYRTEGWTDCRSLMGNQYLPTHWMPLPEPPK
jgi:hypothetical protein